MAGDVGGVSPQDKRSLNVCLEPLRSDCMFVPFIWIQ